MKTLEEDIGCSFVFYERVIFKSKFVFQGIASYLLLLFISKCLGISLDLTRFLLFGYVEDDVITFIPCVL